MSVSRRTLLKAAMGTPLLAGCGSEGAGIEVFVVWSGDELAAFREATDEFSAETGHLVRIVTVGQQAEELLRARLDANNPPDVAVVPLLSLIKESARGGKLVSLDPSLGMGIPGQLSDTVSVNGELFGLWIKVAHKSLFWHRSSTLNDRDAPRTWSELVDLVQRLAGNGRPPLSIGVADGWVVTDWFENVLISVDGGETYEGLAHGENLWESGEVAEALTSLARMWSVPGAFPDGPERAQLTQYEESVTDVFVNKRAELVFEGDFVAGVVDRFRRAGRVDEATGMFRFPPLRGAPPLVVSGDVAVLMNDSAGGRELIQWFARPAAFDGWVRRGGFLSPNLSTTPEVYPTQLARTLAEQLRSSDEVHTDLSDQLGGRFAGGQSRGMFRILPEFFAAVSTPGADVRAATTRAQAELADAARHNRP